MCVRVCGLDWSGVECKAGARSACEKLRQVRVLTLLARPLGGSHVRAGCLGAIRVPHDVMQLWRCQQTKVLAAASSMGDALEGEAAEPCRVWAGVAREEHAPATAG